jgi:O-antigen/teichoic acid export membrane protein
MRATPSSNPTSTAPDRAADSAALPADHAPTRGLRRRYYFRALWSGAAAKVINIGVQVVSMSMTVRYLGKERYGVWTTITTISAWLALANFGLGQGLTTRLSSLGANEEESRELARRSICSTLAMSASIAAFLLPLCLLGAWLVPWATLFKLSTPLAISEVRPTVLISMAVIVMLLPLTIGGSVLSGYQRNDLLNVTSGLSSVLSLILLMIALALRWGMPALSLTIMLPQGASAIAQLLLVRSMGVLPLDLRYVNRHEALRMMRLGVKFLVIQLFGIFIFETGALIIAGKFGVAEVTPYGVTNRLVMVIVTVFSVIASPLWPAYGDAFGRGDLDWARRVFRKSLKLILGLWLCAAVVLGVGGRFIIQIWVGPAAVPSWMLLWTMLLYALSIGLGFVVAFPLNGAGRLTPQVVAAVVCGLLNIPISIYLADKLGIAGVVISQAGVMLLLAIPIQLAAVRRLLRGEGVPTSATG